MIKITCTGKMEEEISEKLSLALINSTLSTRFIKNTGVTVNGINTHLTMNSLTFLYWFSCSSSIPVKIFKALTYAYSSNPVMPHGQQERSIKTNTRLTISIKLPKSSVHILYVFCLSLPAHLKKLFFPAMDALSVLVDLDRCHNRYPAWVYIIM